MWTESAATAGYWCWESARRLASHLLPIAGATLTRSSCRAPRAARDGGRRPFDVGKRGADARQVCLARRRQDDVAVEAQEGADAKIVLELFDAMTDRRLGDTQFVGRLEERLLPRRRREGLVGVHRRQTEGHRAQRRPSTTSATKRLPM